MTTSLTPCSPALAETIDDLLPQWQCGQCGFAACRPYADALAAGSAGIDLCAPGGARTVRALAQLLERDQTPPGPAASLQDSLALIDERRCIGCTLCIQACPVDAIVGAARQMHTVVAAWCTGCALCLPACPVDCIEIMALPRPALHEQPFREAARARYQLKMLREAQSPQKQAARSAARTAASDAQERAQRQALIATALERARLRHQERRQSERKSRDNHRQSKPR